MILSNIDSCDHLTADSDIVQDVVSNPLNYDSVTVRVVKNCCSDQTYEFEADIPTIVADKLIEIHAVDLILLDEDELPTSTTLEDNGGFGDGIYTVTITFLNKDTTTTVEVQCIFLDCVLQCTLVDLVASNPGVSITHILMAHYALTLANDCEDKDCQHMCDVYEYLVIQINAQTNDTTCSTC